jgi:hypothetical protein
LTKALALVLLLEPSPRPVTPPFPYGDVRLARAEGHVLCARNPDGSALIVEAPQEAGWRWYEYDSGGGWFWARRTADDAGLQEMVDFVRVWGQPSCERLRANDRPRPDDDHESRLEHCGASDFPEPGTVRVVWAERFRSVRWRYVQYWTPHGYLFGGTANDAGEEMRGRALLESYRIVPDRGCGPVPEPPHKRRTTKR